MKGVFDVSRVLRSPEEELRIRLVFGEEPLARCAVRRRIRSQAEFIERFVPGLQLAIGRQLDASLFGAALVAAAPDPGVAKPERGQHVNRRWCGAAIGDRDADQRVVGAGLGVLGRHVEVLAAGKDARIEQLELRGPFVVGAAGLDQLFVGKCRLWILIKSFEIGVRRRGVEIVIQFLDVFAVIALRPRQPEQSLFQNRVFLVPQGQGETEAAFAIGDPQEAVLAPAIGPAAGVFMRERAPRVAAGGIVLADGGPLALRQVRPPAGPVAFAGIVFTEAGALGVVVVVEVHAEIVGRSKW